MDYSSDFKSYNQGNKFSKSQVELTRKLAEKYGLKIVDVLNFQSSFGKFISSAIEEKWQVIYFPHFGKFMPLMQKRLKEKYNPDYDSKNEEGRGEEMEDL